LNSYAGYLEPKIALINQQRRFTACFQISTCTVRKWYLLDIPTGLLRMAAF